MISHTLAAPLSEGPVWGCPPRRILEAGLGVRVGGGLSSASTDELGHPRTLYRAALPSPTRRAFLPPGLSPTCRSHGGMRGVGTLKFQGSGPGYSSLLCRQASPRPTQGCPCQSRCRPGLSCMGRQALFKDASSLEGRGGLWGEGAPGGLGAQHCFLGARLWEEEALCPKQHPVPMGKVTWCVPTLPLTKATPCGRSWHCPEAASLLSLDGACVPTI